MNKTLIIIRREFLSRVQKKSFLLSTILLPLFIFGLYALIIYFSIKSDDNLKVAIADQTGLLAGKIKNNTSISYSFVQEKDPVALQAMVDRKEFTGFIIIPEGFSAKSGDSLEFIGNTNIGLMTKEKLQSNLNKGLEKIEVQKLLAPGISLGQLDSTKSDVTLKVSKAGQKNGSTGFAYALGFICGILIYAILFIYGAMVMRGVMEEKTSRIAEVMISSVRPYQLMLGKIIGIGAVGLVQFMIWGVLIIGLQLLLPLLFPQLAQTALQQSPNIPGSTGNSAQMEMVKEILKNMHDVNIVKIFSLFIIYFLGGYLIYSAMFAAVGSAVNEDPQDAQQLMLPITMPIIFSFVIMTQAINKPDGALAMFGSMFPLSSPIVMMARLPYGVPGWQIFLSLLFLVLGIMGTTWLAARIYRTGILMYGKKANWKELWKWAMKG